jgi:hypothetical protein
MQKIKFLGFNRFSKTLQISRSNRKVLMGVFFNNFNDITLLGVNQPKTRNPLATLEVLNELKFSFSFSANHV